MRAKRNLHLWRGLILILPCVPCLVGLSLEIVVLRVEKGNSVRQCVKLVLKYRCGKGESVGTVFVDAVWGQFLWRQNRGTFACTFTLFATTLNFFLVSLTSPGP